MPFGWFIAAERDYSQLTFGKNGFFMVYEIVRKSKRKWFTNSILFLLLLFSVIFHLCPLHVLSFIFYIKFSRYCLQYYSLIFFKKMFFSLIPTHCHYIIFFDFILIFFWYSLTVLIIFHLHSFLSFNGSYFLFFH